MNIPLISAFVLYFGILFSIASAFYKKSASAGAFMLGSREMNYWATAISAQASDMGAWLFLAYPAMIYTSGLSHIWTAIGLVVFMWLNWHIVASRLRTMTAHYNSFTLWSFFTSRFNDPTNRLRIAGTVISIFFFMTYIATGLIGISLILKADFGLAFHHAIILSAFLASGYILIGGFLAAAWCNLFKGLFLLVAITVVPVIAYFQVGGASAIINAVQAHGVSLSIFNSWQAVLLAFGWGLGYFGQPHILVNFMGIKDVDKIKKATRVGIAWQIIVLLAAIAVGLIGHAFFSAGVSDPQQLYLDMVKAIFSPFFVGLISCGVLASIISTATVQMLVAASALSQDIYKTIFNPQASSSRITLVARLATIMLTIMSACVAYMFGKVGVYTFTLFSWSGLGCAFGPLVLLSLFKTSINRHGALAAIISGGISAGMLSIITSSIPGLAVIICFPISFACAYLVSYLTR